MKKRIVFEKYENLVDSQISISKEYKNKIFPEIKNDEDTGYSDSGDKIGSIISAASHDDMAMFVPNNILSEIKLMTLFDAWVCHTNFTISKKILEQISKIEGVEMIKPLTRYRFIFSIGRCFDMTEFRKSLNKELGIEDTTEERGIVNEC